MAQHLVFMYGFLGAVMVEFQSFYDDFKRQDFEVVGIPSRHKYDRLYWVVLLAHAVIAGILTLACAQTYPRLDALSILAVGGSSRLIILKFGQFVSNLKDRKVEG